MTDNAHDPFAESASLPASVLGDVWRDITGKVTETAVGSINKAIKDQLGETGGAVLGPVVAKGMGALVDALGLDSGKPASELDKVMNELAKVKEILVEMQGELRKIDAAVQAVGERVSREAERLNQAAKYRDYVNARESIDAMWTTTWSLITAIAAQPEDRDAVSSARALYANQTVNFIRDTLLATANLRNAVLKMFGDNESLFLYMSKASQPLVRDAILRQVSGGMRTDGFTLLKTKKPEVWQALLDGPCGDVLRDMKAYGGNGLDGRSGGLPRFWYGDSWFIFMEAARAAVANQILASPLTVCMAEVNIAFSRALIILTIIYGRNPGLAVAANKVIGTLHDVAAEANPRYQEFIRSLVGWIGDVGSWGISPMGKRPGADRSRLFGLWAAHWMDTSTDLLYPCSYAKDGKGKTYPCSLFVNHPDVRRVAETIWKNPSAINFVYEKTGPHAFGYRSLGLTQLGQPLETWSREHAETRLPMVQTGPALPAV